ncbi:mitochondrial carrier protein [Nitzschia inconspicua]|uniref:Mitochondrial carrier protein n=1 Tax=Nitzschia inconspicua TaxID=303405 RepID=A0A9K3K612_9STRA|nr:mitochondrial carrier protein [Nitzschia inconspicua]KAG7371655.1 mitochondrial carrier protein [Nitzschia inconspicua]
MKKDTSSSRSVLSSLLVGVLLVFHQMGSVHASPSAAGSAALQALKSIDYRYFVAGGTCAAFSHGITTPIDVVKTRLQADPKKYKGGLLDATVQICQTDGPTTLLQGLGPTVIGYGVEGAMKFGVYEVCKPILSTVFFPDNPSLAFVWSSFLAGAVAAVLLVPMESLRIKQVTDVQYRDDTVLTGIPKLIRQDGFVQMMSGTWAMLAKQVPYTFGKQVSFDIIAATLYQVVLSRRVTLSAGVQKWLVSIVAAFCASMVACLCSQPGDMILTETYQGGGDRPGAFGRVVRTIYQRGGPAEFFRGTSARMVHVGMIITSQLVVYDLVKQLLGLPATGSH